MVNVESWLGSYATRTRAAIDAFLPHGEPRGHLYDLVGEYPARGGKAIRPSLCLATCVAFGGELEDAMASAVAIELLHNAFLVHDDIEDGSEKRRGFDTLHTRHGVALAINAGDALAMLGFAALRNNSERLGSRLAARIAGEFDAMTRRTIEGQAIELGWRRDNVVDLTPDDYLDVIMRKTCWYTTVHPLRIGALIGSWGRCDLDAFVRFGFLLGAAFQIRDDVLNIVGTDERYGKEWCGDLLEGKRTLMLIHLLSVLDSSDRRELVEFLARDRAGRSASEALHVRDLMVAHGSIDFARSYGMGIASAAEDAFDRAFAGVADCPERRFVHGLIDWMLHRQR